MNKWFKRSIPVFLIVGLVLVSACASAPPVPAPMPMPPPSEEPYPGGKEYDSNMTVPGEMATERKIVKTGYMTLEVEDIAEAMDEVTSIARGMDGYVVSSHKYEDEKISGNISIRIPAEKFDEVMEELRRLAISVPSESTQSVDVTEEYVDLEARLHNLEATEAQYLALMDKAETVEEILKVQGALSGVRGEIERIKGRMQYLERTSDMSLIEVSLQESQPLVGPWSPGGVLASAAHGLVVFGRGLFVLVVWLGVFCWIWIPLLVIWRKRRKKKA